MDIIRDYIFLVNNHQTLRKSNKQNKISHALNIFDQIIMGNEVSLDDILIDLNKLLIEYIEEFLQDNIESNYCNGVPFKRWEVSDNITTQTSDCYVVISVDSYNFNDFGKIKSKIKKQWPLIGIKCRILQSETRIENYRD
jgi:hypothetical protein